MASSNPFFSDAKKDLEEYLQNRVLLFKMQAADASSKLVARLTVVILLGLMAFSVLFFVSIMAGYFFARLTGSIEWGFAIIAACYFLLFLFFFLIRKKLTQSITNSIVQILFKNDE